MPIRTVKKGLLNSSVVVSFYSNSSSTTLSKIRKNLATFNKGLRNTTRKISKNLPRTADATLSNKIKRYFGENYLNKEGWTQTESKGGRAKDKALQRGDSFTVGNMGTFPIRFDSSVFGRRTDTLFNFLRSPMGSEVKFYSSSKSVGRGYSFSAATRIRLKSEMFNGSYYQIPGDDINKRYQLDTVNELIEFDKVSGSSEFSVFTKLTDAQNRSIIRFVREKWGPRIKELIVLETRELLAKAARN